MTSLRTASPLCATEAFSADLSPSVYQRFLWWAERPGEHARFLNTLALLEHIGSRKIMASQSRGPLGLGVLKHLAEETRHAFFFKRVAEKLAKRPLGFHGTDVIEPAAAWMYFGRLDAGITRTLGADAHPEVPYLFVSLIIELRAIWAYRLYQKALTEAGVALSLKSVLAEEELHLSQMLENLDSLGAEPQSRIEPFARLEHHLFNRFWKQVEHGLEPLPQAA